MPRVSTTDPFADGDLVGRLRALHDHYVEAVNRAVADDRYDLVAELVAGYPDEALDLMAPCPVDAPRPQALRRPPASKGGRAARWASALWAALH
jgi:hypothetical protein